MIAIVRLIEGRKAVLLKDAKNCRSNFNLLLLQDSPQNQTQKDNHAKYF